MCHRRGDWSRTSSRASEPDEETDESAWVGARAKDLLVTVVSGGTAESTDETPEPDPETTSVEPETPNADSTGEEDEKTDVSAPENEENPIPADD